MEQTVGTLSVRVDKLERDTIELFDKTNTANINLAAVNEKLASMLTTLGEVKQAVAGLQSVPGNKWNTLVMTLAAALIGAVIGHFFK